MVMTLLFGISIGMIILSIIITFLSDNDKIPDNVKGKVICEHAWVVTIVFFILTLLLAIILGLSTTNSNSNTGVTPTPTQIQLGR